MPRPAAQIYIHDRTQVEAAAALGCSRSRLSYLHRESLEMLNDSFRWKDPDGEDAAAPTRRGADRAVRPSYRIPGRHSPDGITHRT